jgi:hypothetical protein
MDEAKYQAQLQAQIEVLQRWLDRAQPSNRPAYRHAVERKQSLERELELSKLRVSFAKARTATNAPLEEQSPRPGNERQKFVQPLLEAKGWSIHDWAKNASVDFHTANNYLKGKTNPYPNTRKKLADALGVRNLPT